MLVTLGTLRVNNGVWIHQGLYMQFSHSKFLRGNDMNKKNNQGNWWNATS